MNSKLLGFRSDNAIETHQVGIAKHYGDLHIYVGGLVLEQLGWQEDALVGVLVDQTGYRLALAPDRRGLKGCETGTAFGDAPCPPRRFETPLGPNLNRVIQQERWQSDEVIVCAFQCPDDNEELGNVVPLHPSLTHQNRPGILLLDIPRLAAASERKAAALLGVVPAPSPTAEKIERCRTFPGWAPVVVGTAVLAGVAFGVGFAILRTAEKPAPVALSSPMDEYRGAAPSAYPEAFAVEQSAKEQMDEPEIEQPARRSPAYSHAERNVPAGK